MSAKDIIRSAKESDPTEFTAAVESELAVKLTAALDTKKAEFAQSIFNAGEENSDEV